MKKPLKALAWSDFPKPCYYDPQERFGDFSGTIVDILRDERIPASHRLLAMTCEGILDDRTLRLFACKCVQSTPIGDGQVVWDVLSDSRSREAVNVAERFANGESTTEEIEVAWYAAVGGGVENHAARGAAQFWSAASAARAAGQSAVALAAWQARGVAKGNGWEAAAKMAQIQFAIELIEINYKC